MPTPVLPEELATRYEVQAATLSDADDLYDMLVHRAIDIVGYVNITRGTATSSLTPLYPQEPRWSFVIRERITGALVTLTTAERGYGTDRMAATVRSDTRLDSSDADALAAAIWPQLIAWSRSVHPPDEDGNIILHAGAVAPDTSLIASLTAVGFAYDRTFWSMSCATVDQPDPPASAPGTAIEPATDPRVVHAILEAGFAGTWGFSETPCEEWFAAAKVLPGFDLDLWRIATVDGVPAAVMIMSRESEIDELYVAELATLADFRHRGLASALLAHAFDQARADGLARVSLHVDTANADNAPAVYRRAGLAVRYAAHQYLLRLPV